MAEFRSSRAPDAEPGLFSLTQIRHLMKVEFSRAQRYDYPVACLMLQIDRLGSLRDLYGYDAKEALVEDLVKLLETQTRSSDYLGRLVDDRLMAVLPHTAQAGALTACKRLVDATRRLSLRIDGKELHPSLSIGLSVFEKANAMYFDELLDAAEAALQEAQQQGGDRAVQRALKSPRRESGPKA